MQIDRAFIEREFNQFFEFDSEDRRTVTSVSCRLFAEHIAQRAAEQEREDCAAVAKSISDKYAVGHYGQEVDTADEIEVAIRARMQVPA